MALQRSHIVLFRRTTWVLSKVRANRQPLPLKPIGVQEYRLYPYLLSCTKQQPLDAHKLTWHRTLHRSLQGSVCKWLESQFRTWISILTTQMWLTIRIRSSFKPLCWVTPNQTPSIFTSLTAQAKICPYQPTYGAVILTGDPMTQLYAFWWIPAPQHSLLRPLVANIASAELCNISIQSRQLKLHPCSWILTVPQEDQARSVWTLMIIRPPLPPSQFYLKFKTRTRLPN